MIFLNNVIVFGRNYEDYVSELNYEVDSLYVFIKVVLFLIGDEVIIFNYKDIIE